MKENLKEKRRTKNDYLIQTRFWVLANQISFSKKIHMNENTKRDLKLN